MRTVLVEIRKPLDGRTYVGIRDSYIREAKRLGVPLEIRIPLGVAVVSPEDWLAKAKPAKMYRKYPQPMTMYYGHVPIKIPVSEVVSLQSQKIKQSSLL